MQAVRLAEPRNGNAYWRSYASRDYERHYWWCERHPYACGDYRYRPFYDRNDYYRR